MNQQNKLSIRLSQAVSLSILLASVIAAGATACRNNVTTLTGGKSMLQVRLNHSPAQFDSVITDTGKVEVQNADSARGLIAVYDSSTMVNPLTPN